MAEPLQVEWHPFDYDNKPATRPPHGGPVWIVERYYAQGVTLGCFDGFTFRAIGGSDDCCVTYWAEIAYPDAPEGWDDEDEGDND